MIVPAGGACSIEKKLMPCGTKSAWQLGLAGQDAAFQLIQFSAVVALKVMMMSLAGYLVACRLAGQFDRLQPPFERQRLNIAVDRGNTQCRVVTLRGGQSLLGRKRPIRFDKRISDSCFLFCVSFFHDCCGIYLSCLYGIKGPRR